MRLVRRLTLLLLLIIGVVFAADTYLSIRQHLEIFDSDLRRDERLLGRALAHAVELVWQERDQEAALDLVQGADDRQGEVRIRLVHLDQPVDTVLGPDVPIGTLESDGRPRIIKHVRDDVVDERLYTFVPLSVPGAEHAALELSASIAGEKAYLADQIRSRLVTAGILFATCGAVAWVVGAHVVGRPIERLVGKARRIGMGDFSDPIALRQQDELSQLADEINAMAAALDAGARDLAARSAAHIAALDQLHHADRLSTIGKLASGLAHELGTPLNVVSGRARMIADGELDDPGDVAVAASIIADQAERMTRIVRQLLDFARKRKAERRDTDLVQVADQVVTLLAPLAGDARVSIDFQHPGEPVRASADPQQLQQAVINLVMNAIQAARGGGHVRVSVTEERAPCAAAADSPAGHHAVIEIADDGVGIPAENLSSIFDPFFTTRMVGEGTGLGLAVAHGIVAENGGRIDVWSESGKGSVFQIRLPSGQA